MKSSRSPAIQAPSGITLAFSSQELSLGGAHRLSRSSSVQGSTSSRQAATTLLRVVIGSPNSPTSTSSSATFQPSDRRDIKGCRFALAGASTASHLSHKRLSAVTLRYVRK